MTLKRPKNWLPYVPERANGNEKVLRRVAGTLTGQHDLEAFLLRMAPGKPEHKRRELQHNSFEMLRPYLRFHATLPEFLDVTAWEREEDGFRCPVCHYFEHGYYEGDDFSSVPKTCGNCGIGLTIPQEVLA
jgi:hypothetical protein